MCYKWFHERFTSAKHTDTSKAPAVSERTPASAMPGQPQAVATEMKMPDRSKSAERIESEMATTA